MSFGRSAYCQCVTGWIVDALPRRLWRPLNMYFGARLHFCMHDGVRTVEWNDRILARGRRPFPHAWFDAELARLNEDA